MDIGEKKDGSVNHKVIIEKKVFSHMEELRMLKPGDRVVVGVSGGADSVCLFLLLSEYAKLVPLSLAVVHVNHGIRREAGEDARFVEEMCRERNVPFFLVEEDVRKLAKQEGCSEEDAGRRVRYGAFFMTAERLGGARIAVAHNSNDNAETMLFHLFRGSGLQGLGGIAPVRGDIIRPILCLERREVEAYLESVSARWCHDSTNEGDDYRRNRIRHHILPYAEEAVASGAVGHMGRTAELLRETEDYLDIQTQAALEKCMEAVSDRKETWRSGGRSMESLFGSRECIDERQGKSIGEGQGKSIGERQGKSNGGKPGSREAANTDCGCCRSAGKVMCGGEEPDAVPYGEENMPGRGVYQINIACFCQNHTVLQKRMLLKLLNKLSPTGKDISAVHVTDTLALFEREGNRSISLPFGIRARRQYGSVFLERKTEALSGDTPSGSTWQEQPLKVSLGEEIFCRPVVYGLGDWGKIEFTGFSLKKGQEVPIKRYTKWLDYDKIKEYVVVRSRCQGDYLTIADGRGNIIRKSVKNYMITEKIPKQIRDEIPVVAAGNHVLWLAGWRISEAFKVDECTERILQIRLLGAECCEDGETEEKDGGEH